jgi:hypothetical protein
MSTEMTDDARQLRTICTTILLFFALVITSCTIDNHLQRDQHTKRLGLIIATGGSGGEAACLLGTHPTDSAVGRACANWIAKQP